jgi:hypothetical protein
MRARQKVANRRLVSLADNLQAFSLPRGCVFQTGILLSQLQAGSYVAKNRDKILVLAKHLKRLRVHPAKAAGPRCRPEKKLVDLPPYTRTEAYGRRPVLGTYLEALSDGLIPAQAERIARLMSLLIFDRAISCKQLRRLVARWAPRGGITRAPIRAFATEKSIPHPGNAKPKKASRRQ